MIHELIMFSEKQQIQRIWQSAKNLSHSKSVEFLDDKICHCSNMAFWKKKLKLGMYGYLVDRHIFIYMYVIFKQI